MDFSFSEREIYFRDRVKAFIDQQIRPRQAEYDEQHHSGERWKVIPVIEEMKEKTKAAGLWNFFMPPHSGQRHVDDTFVFEGTQLTNLEYALCAEEMARSAGRASASTVRHPIPAIWRCSTATARSSRRSAGCAR